MAETVYIFGAGVNYGITDESGRRPPLSNDLFQQTIGHKDINIGELRELTDFIEKYWKLSVENLRTQPFDIEECFTFLQQQRADVQQGQNLESDSLLKQTEDQLSALLTKYLGFIEGFVSTNAAFLELGHRLLDEQPAILTFNYDTIIETSIELASGDNENRYRGSGFVPDYALSQSRHKWNRSLAYGVQFDEVQLQDPGSSFDPVEGDRFYNWSDNQLYDPPILKLHGSLNWYEHTSDQLYPEVYGTSNLQEGKITLTGGYPLIKYDFDLPRRNGFALKPVLITPVLYKELSTDLFKQIWQRAREELSDCHTLIVAGYSFPPSDFAMRKLFLEAFVDGPPRTLVSINPDHSVATRAAQLCHHANPKVYDSLESFLDIRF